MSLSIRGSSLLERARQYNTDMIASNQNMMADVERQNSGRTAQVDNTVLTRASRANVISTEYQIRDADITADDIPKLQEKNLKQVESASLSAVSQKTGMGRALDLLS